VLKTAAHHRTPKTGPDTAAAAAAAAAAAVAGHTRLVEAAQVRFRSKSWKQRITL
jgi:hypothetical protein